MRHKDGPGIRIVVPVHGGSVKPGTLSSILKKAELSIGKLERLL